MEFSGNRRVTVWSDGAVRLAFGGTLTTSVTSAARAIAVSPSGGQLAVALGDGAIDIWKQDNRAQFQKTQQKIESSTSPPATMAWLSEDSMVIQTEGDRLVQIEVTDPVKRLCALVGDSESAACKK